MAPFTIDEVREAVVFTSDIGAAARRSGLREGKLQVVGMNSCAETEMMAQCQTPWDRRAFATAVRMIAAMHRSHDESVLVGSPAAALHGMQVSDLTTDITLSAPFSPNRRPARFAPLTWVDVDPQTGRRSEFVVPRGRLHRVRIALEPEAVTEVEGIRVLAPLENAVWTVGREDADTGFQVASQHARVEGRFDRDDPEGSRARESAIRQAMLECAGRHPRWIRHHDQALWILGHADAGCESPGEHKLVLRTRGTGVVGVVTQLRVITKAGPRFADLAIIYAQTIGEYEGKAKDGATLDERGDARADRDRRDKDLAPRNWRVVHVYARDLHDVPQLLADFQAYAAKPLIIDPTLAMPGPLPWDLENAIPADEEP